MNKRVFKEVSSLLKQESFKNFLDNDYLVYQDEENMNIVYALIKAPKDSVYRHKFIILKIVISDTYPYTPPQVFFLNFDNKRIHPNLYEDGKCCSTILNTWPSDNEKWTSSMNIETIIVMIQSFLDNNPYKHEPGGRDDDSYTIYVLHQTFYTCLFAYIFNQNIPEKFKNYIQEYVYKYSSEILSDIELLSLIYAADDYYTKCFEIYNFYVNYNLVKIYFKEYLSIITMTKNILNDLEIPDSFENKCEKQECDNKNFKCSICFDSNDKILAPKEFMILDCNHKFHKECLYFHIKNNGLHCSMCRTNINRKNLKINNCSSNRSIIIGKKTYNKLIKHQCSQTRLPSE